MIFLLFRCFYAFFYFVFQIFSIFAKSLFNPLTVAPDTYKGKNMKRIIALLIIASSLVLLCACNARYNEETDDLLQRYSSFVSSENADSCRVLSSQLSGRKLNDEQSSRLSRLDAEYRQLQEKLDELERIRREQEEELERIRREQEERERIMRSFVGTYTIHNCKERNFSTIHVPKSYFTSEQDVSTYEGYTTWDLEIVVRDDFSVYTREVNIREYNKYDRLSSTKESRRSLEAGSLYAISDNLFTVISRSDFEIVKYAPYCFCYASGSVDEKETGFSLKTNHLCYRYHHNTIGFQIKQALKKGQDRQNS